MVPFHILHSFLSIMNHNHKPFRNSQTYTDWMILGMMPSLITKKKKVTFPELDVYINILQNLLAITNHRRTNINELIFLKQVHHGWIWHFEDSTAVTVYLHSVIKLITERNILSQRDLPGRINTLHKQKMVLRSLTSQLTDTKSHSVRNANLLPRPQISINFDASKYVTSSG